LRKKGNHDLHGANLIRALGDVELATKVHISRR
jgi:hypothetical protein